MARRKLRNGRSTTFRNQLQRPHLLRDAPIAIASDFSDRVFEPVQRSLPAFQHEYFPAVRSPLTEVEDRRTYHPSGRIFRPVSSPRRHQVKTKAVPKTAFLQTAIHAFQAPKFVAVCIRRKVRDEVLHALGKTGRGSRFHKKPRRNSLSQIRC